MGVPLPRSTTGTCRILPIPAKLGPVNQPTDPGELARIAGHLAQLRQEHRALDAEIENLQANLANDELQIKRLKRRKLQLKDLITRLESALIPDQPA